MRARIKAGSLGNLIYRHIGIQKKLFRLGYPRFDNIPVDTHTRMPLEKSVNVVFVVARYLRNILIRYLISVVILDIIDSVFQGERRAFRLLKTQPVNIYKKAFQGGAAPFTEEDIFLGKLADDHFGGGTRTTVIA